jgi:hypothetical protein
MLFLLMCTLKKCKLLDRVSYNLMQINQTNQSAFHKLNTPVLYYEDLSLVLSSKEWVLFAEMRLITNSEHSSKDHLKWLVVYVNKIHFQITSKKS